jgi:hypothetical protein
MTIPNRVSEGWLGATIPVKGRKYKHMNLKEKLKYSKEEAHPLTPDHR